MIECVVMHCAVMQRVVVDFVVIDVVVYRLRDGFWGCGRAPHLRPIAVIRASGRARLDRQYRKPGRAESPRNPPAGNQSIAAQ